MKYAIVRNNKVSEILTEEAYKTLNSTVKAMCQVVPENVGNNWKLVNDDWVEPDPMPEPKPIYRSLTKLEFVRLIKEHGGTTNQMIVDAKKNTNLEFFWLMFDLTDKIHRYDTEIDEGLDALVELKYLPNGKQSVLDNWSTVQASNHLKNI